MCILEHCEDTRTTRRVPITFKVDAGRKYHATVALCGACYKELWHRKRTGTARYDVLFAEQHTTADIDAVRHHARVDAMRLLEDGHA